MNAGMSQYPCFTFFFLGDIKGVPNFDLSICHQREVHESNCDLDKNKGVGSKCYIVSAVAERISTLLVL